MSESAFDYAALYQALDRERQRRELTWAGAAREIRVAASTIARLGASPRTAEADGVLQMLRWLGQPPERFLPDAPATRSAPWPSTDESRIVRVDARALYAAIDDRRAQRTMTWQAVARELGLSNPSAVTRLRQGGRVSFSLVLRVTDWLERPLTSFLRGNRPEPAA